MHGSRRFADRPRNDGSLRCVTLNGLHDPPRRTVLSARRALGRSDRARHAAGSAVDRRGRIRRAAGDRIPRPRRSATPSWKRWSRSRPPRSCAPATARTHSVALFLGNTPDHPVNFFGALKAGARIVHLSPLDGEIALSHKLSDSGARVLVTSNLAALLPTALKFLDKGLLDRLIVCEDDDWGKVGTPQTPLPDQSRDHHLPAVHRRRREAGAVAADRADDVALLQYTGGTTGLPKGAMLSHGNLTAAVSIYDVWGKPARAERDAIERVICVLPLFHIFALTVVLLSRAAPRQSDLAAPALRRRGRDARHRGQARHRVPRRADDVDRDRRASRSRQARSVVAGELRLRRRAAAGRGRKDLRAQGRHEAEERLGHDRDLLARHRPSQGRPGQAGLDRADAARHRDGRGRRSTIPTKVLPPGEVGEIRIRGPNVTKGYWNRPKETAEAFVGDRFLTGDIGYMDADGYFYLVDRKKDMIISGGFNVYPQMIEQAIYDASRRAGSDRDRHSRRLSRRGGQGLRQAARRCRAVHAGRAAHASSPASSASTKCPPRSSSSTNCRAPRSASCRATNCASSAPAPKQQQLGSGGRS